MKKVIFTLAIIIATLNVFGQNESPIVRYHSMYDIIYVEGNAGDTAKISFKGRKYYYPLKGGSEYLSTNMYASGKVWNGHNVVNLESYEVGEFVITTYSKDDDIEKIDTCWFYVFDNRYQNNY